MDSWIIISSRVNQCFLRGLDPEMSLSDKGVVRKKSHYTKCCQLCNGWVISCIHGSTFVNFRKKNLHLHLVSEQLNFIFNYFAYTLQSNVSRSSKNSVSNYNFRSVLLMQVIKLFFINLPVYKMLGQNNRVYNICTFHSFSNFSVKWHACCHTSCTSHTA